MLYRLAQYCKINYNLKKSKKNFFKFLFLVHRPHQKVQMRERGKRVGPVMQVSETAIITPKATAEMLSCFLTSIYTLSQVGAPLCLNSPGDSELTTAHTARPLVASACVRRRCSALTETRLHSPAV